MGGGRTRVLLVEDNPGDARLIKETLADGREAFDMSHAGTIREALEALSIEAVDVVLLDLGLPDSRGRDSFEQIRAHVPDTPVIVLTGSDDEELALDLVKSGAQDYLVKGEIGDAVLGRAIRYAVERHRAERARVESEARFRSMVKNLPVGLCQVDADGGFLMANPRFVEMLGLASEREVRDLGSIADVYADPGVPDLLMDAFAETDVIAPVEAEWKGAEDVIKVRISGRTVRDDDGEVRYLDLIVEDVTREKLMERHLRQAQKMEAIGQLAGGVAHDFNNLLTVIEGHSAGLLEQMSEADAARAAVEEIRGAATRAAWLTRQLLTFGKRQVVQPRVVDLNEVVREEKKILRRLIEAGIDLRSELADEPVFVHTDRGQLGQVVLNLVVNARDALGAEGRIIIATGVRDLDEEEASRFELPPGRYASLHVRDTGSGIPADVLDHLWEPFFSTKEEGTGLGLATVYGIVEQAGGSIGVESTPEGTTFTVCLPLAEPPTEDHQKAPRKSVGGTRRTGTVLVADDQDAIRRLVARIMEMQGHSVLSASDGREALRLVERHEGTIDLLITDVEMPRMKGMDLAREVRRVHEGCRVIFMSGYSEDAVLEGVELLAGGEFLAKPFDPSQLLQVVETAMDSPARKAPG